LTLLLQSCKIVLYERSEASSVAYFMPEVQQSCKEKRIIHSPKE
jgi:hypothetical protein